MGTPFASDDDLLKASDVILAAQCELNREAARPDQAFPFRKAVLTMTMTVVVTEATGGGLTLAIPIAGSRISLERGRRPVGSAVRRMDVRFVHDVTTAIDCPAKERPTTENGVRYIDGGLGLDQWIRETDLIAARSGALPAEVNYALNFDISLSDSFNPVFSRSSSSGVSPDLTPENTDARRVGHQIAVTIVPEERGRRLADAALLEAAQRFQDRLPRN